MERRGRVELIKSLLPKARSEEAPSRTWPTSPTPSELAWPSLPFVFLSYTFTRQHGLLHPRRDLSRPASQPVQGARRPSTGALAICAPFGTKRLNRPAFPLFPPDRLDLDLERGWYGQPRSVLALQRLRRRRPSLRHVLGQPEGRRRQEGLDYQRREGGRVLLVFE